METALESRRARASLAVYNKIQLNDFANNLKKSYLSGAKVQLVFYVQDLVMWQFSFFLWFHHNLDVGSLSSQILQNYVVFLTISRAQRLDNKLIDIAPSHLSKIFDLCISGTSMRFSRLNNGVTLRANLHYFWFVRRQFGFIRRWSFQIVGLFAQVVSSSNWTHATRVLVGSGSFSRDYWNILTVIVDLNSSMFQTLFKKLH